MFSRKKDAHKAMCRNNTEEHKSRKGVITADMATYAVPVDSKPVVFSVSQRCIVVGIPDDP